jgi:dTMP kinase
LQAKGVNVVLTREPGGTDLGEQIRELLLMFSARNEHIHSKIIPALNNGDWVLSDRFTDASYAYQGGGRGLDMQRIEQLEKWVLQDFTPDMTLLLDIPVEQGMERVKSRGKKDRIELENMDFFERVRQAYIDRSKAYPERIKLINSAKTKEYTSMQIAQILADL